MTEQRFRIATGGGIDRSSPLEFWFDGRAYSGFAGDTLASGLLANGVRLVGRSFKYHRPRGIFGLGGEEPNALVRLRRDNRAEPNVRATQVELYDGLSATSQNYWPSLEFDIGALNNFFSRLLPAGFYYKTFMWPPSWWMFYERFIRRAAGLGRSATKPDPDRYDWRFAHTDVLVVGAGPAGLMAALSAARSGLRVLLADEQREPGGRLLFERYGIDGGPAMDWVARVTAELESLPNVRILPRSVVFGYYDNNLMTIAEAVADHLPTPAPHQPRVRLWKVRAGRVVLCPGAIERPLVFPGNDRPGVMLASAAQGYANHYAVRCGTRAAVFTNNDSAYQKALDLQVAGIEVAAIIDSREGGAGSDWQTQVEQAGIECLNGHVITRTHGVRRVRGVDVIRYDASADRTHGPDRIIRCDLIACAGGYNPTVHLFSQSQGQIEYNESLSGFVPGEPRQPSHSAGAVTGGFGLAECLQAGGAAGSAAVEALGTTPVAVEVPVTTAPPSGFNIEPLWAVPLPPHRHAKRFIDLQNDVTVDDVTLAAREGYRSVEHLKRYTTLGMGTDQGRISNVNGLAVLAATLGSDIPAVGATTFRPPFSPVALGAIAGREIGEEYIPVRRTPMHDWHVQHGAPLIPAGQWMRPQYYPRDGEGIMDAINREAKGVRDGVGVIDVSTLGKIEIQGRDAAEFLERVYINRWKSLKVGKSRYGLMLREDGFLFDDGTTTRVNENHYYMTTTTANAGPVMSHLEFYAQTVWPDLHVHLTSVSDQWGGLALAGPGSRNVLGAVVEDADVSHEAFPFMGYMEATVAGVLVRVFRITFSGELAYEIHMPSDYGVHVWEALLAAGEPWKIFPYGTEALSVLRIEKGHIVSAEIDGRTLASDFGFERMQRPDSDFIGKRSLDREGLRESRKTLVGLRSNDPTVAIPRGAQIVADPQTRAPVPMLGHVSSRCYSPNLRQEIALALIDSASKHDGKTLYAMSPLTDETVPVTVTHPVFIDPNRERCRV